MTLLSPSPTKLVVAPLPCFLFGMEADDGEGGGEERNGWEKAFVGWWLVERLVMAFIPFAPSACAVHLPLLLLLSWRRVGGGWTCCVTCGIHLLCLFCYTALHHATSLTACCTAFLTFLHTTAFLHAFVHICLHGM